MNNVMSFVIGLVAGSVVTFFASKKYMQTKFDNELTEEITAFKDSYRERINNAVSLEEIEEDSEELKPEDKRALAEENDLIRYNKMYEIKHEKAPVSADIIPEDDPKHPGESATNVIELITESETEQWIQAGYGYEFYEYYTNSNILIDRRGDRISPECVLGESIAEMVAEMHTGQVCFVRDELEGCLYEVQVY